MLIYSVQNQSLLLSVKNLQLSDYIRLFVYWISCKSLFAGELLVQKLLAKYKLSIDTPFLLSLFYRLLSLFPRHSQHFLFDRKQVEDGIDEHRSALLIIWSLHKKLKYLVQSYCLDYHKPWRRLRVTIIYSCFLLWWQ
jgi:hypothetical protein